MLYIYVGLAGALGALARYGIGLGIGLIWTNVFPVGTLVINLIGSFLLGWMTHFLFRTDKFPSQIVTIIGTGMIGSFTTFSTFSVETILLMENGRIGLALLYVASSVGLGLFSSWFGYHLGARRLRRRNEVL